jgi:hypothetical protein
MVEPAAARPHRRRVPRENGKRRQIARDFRRKADAETWATDQASLIERKGIGAGDACFASFFERWARYLEERGELEKKTAHEYRGHGRRLFLYIGSKPLGKLTALDLDDAYSALLRRGGKGGRPLSARTVHRIHLIAHNCLNRAVRVAPDREQPGIGG